MNVLFQLVSGQDMPTLLELMREFYPQQKMHLDEKAATAAAQTLMNGPDLGEIYFIFRGADLAGYFVLTFCFSLEFHGKFALLDELYIREAFRRQKLGQAVVALAENRCRKAGIKALRLEVGQQNAAAQALYRAAGLTQDERFLFTKWL
ncbi:MAG TPA: GNAT family N-acetyltransferase [Candidatus Angelobacter sp.]